MPTIEENFRTLLAAAPTAIGTRWTVYKGPERPVKPYGIVHRVSEDAPHSHSGMHGTYDATLQASVFADSQVESAGLADYLRDYFATSRQTVGAMTIVLSFSGILYAYEDDTKLHHHAVRFDAMYRSS